MMLAGLDARFHVASCVVRNEECVLINPKFRFQINKSIGYQVIRQSGG